MTQRPRATFRPSEDRLRRGRSVPKWRTASSSSTTSARSTTWRGPISSARATTWSRRSAAATASRSRRPCAPTSSCSTSCSPTSTASRSAPSCAATRTSRSSCSRPSRPRTTASAGSTSAPTTTSSSRSARASSWRACAPSCAAPASAASAAEQALRFDDGRLCLDPERHQAVVEGRPVELTPSEFKLLLALARSPGRVFSRFELINRVQGHDYDGYERTIDAHVKNLRRKIEPDAGAAALRADRARRRLPPGDADCHEPAARLADGPAGPHDGGDRGRRGRAVDDARLPLARRPPEPPRGRARRELRQPRRRDRRGPLHRRPVLPAARSPSSSSARAPRASTSP